MDGYRNNSVVIVLSMFIVLFFLVPDIADAANWWDTSWQYRKAITINGSTTNLSDYQVLVNLTASNFNFSRANSQGNDTRFTWLNTTSGLEQNVSFWIENWTSSGADGNATIWVKVPNVTASTVANTTLYMYYGNSSATYNNSLGGNDTFVFFDDFSGDLSKWNIVGSVSISSGEMLMTGANGWQYTDANTKQKFPTPPYVLEYTTVARTSNPTVMVAYVSGEFLASNSNYATIYQESDTIEYLLVNDVTYGGIKTNTTEKDKLVLTGAVANAYANNLLIGSHDFSGSSASHDFSFNVYQTGRSAQFDDVRVRKYASPEPSVLSIGAEQILDLTPPAITIQSPQNITYSTQSIWFNITGNEGLNWSAYSLDGASNISLDNTTSNWNKPNSSMTEGVHNVIFYANDTSGNMNTSLVRYFTVDTTYPQYSQNSTNTTIAGQSILFSLYWTDNIAIVGYIFSFDNGTGIFVNDSFSAMAGTGNWSNVSKTVNSTVGSTIRWKVYVNDSAGNINISETYSYITTACGNPLSGDWVMSSSLNCSSASINITGNLVIPVGYFITFDNVTLEVNNINVTAGSTLMFENSKNSIIQNGNLTVAGTLIINSTSYYMNSTNDGNTGIEVLDGGSLYILNGSNITNGANVAGGNASAHYFFWVRAGANFSMNDSALSESGWADANYARGLEIWAQNTVLRNNTIYENYVGLSLYNSSNNITGGSITATQNADYYLSGAGTNNNFTNTNFTAKRWIQFADATSWFNYQNDSSQNIWLKTNVSAAGSINRTLVTWNNNTMKWNETPSSALTATYNLTGLLPTTTYAIYNTSGSTKTKAYTQDTDADGILPSFTIAINANTEIQVQALNLTSCGDLDLPETYDLVGNVSSSATCFTIKSNNVTLDGAGWTINYSKIGNGYGINNSLGYDYITLKNLNIVQENTSATGTANYAFVSYGMENSTISNVTINVKDSSARVLFLSSNSDFNNITNNTLISGGGASSSVDINSSSSNNIINNTMNTSGTGNNVKIESSSISNVIHNNNMIVTGTSSAVNIITDSNSNNITSNTITTTNTNGYGVYITGINNTFIDNNNIKTSGSAGRGIWLSTNSYFNTLSNNIINTTNANGRGIYVYSSSNYNNITNNTITTSGDSAYGIHMFTNANSNTLLNNTIETSNTNAYGVYTQSSIDNNFSDGSIIALKSSDYYFSGANTTNNFINTNFTALRNISFYDSTSWFNYNNETNGNIWLKNSLSAAGSLNRTLATWSNSTMKWNETPSAALTTTYNITGLLASTTYAIYNTTGGTMTKAYTQDTDASGVLPSFTIALNGETQIQVQALNLSACGDLDLPEAYNLVGNVSSDATCFTIKSNNVTLDGNGYTINYSKTATGYGINNTLGYNFTTIKNANILQNTTQANSYAIYFVGASNGTIQNNTITTSGATGLGIRFITSSNSNIMNNTITTSGSNGFGIYLQSSSNSNILSNNTIFTSGTNGYGITLHTDSNSNTASNNTITTLNTSAYGAYIYDSASNNINGGSIVAAQSSAYNIDDTNNPSSINNNFTNTNFTAQRNIYLNTVTSWFNYQNDSSQNIWLKNLLSAAGSINRTLTTWSNSTMKWNETPSAELTATYNITGLLQSQGYFIYNTSGGTRTNSYNLTTTATGDLPSFTIALSSGANTEIQASTTYYVTGCMDNLNVSGATYQLTANVSSSASCFTIKANNVTLDGNGYWINYSQIGNGYGINNTDGYNFTTIKNAWIVQDNSSASGSNNHAIYAKGMSNSTITNVTIVNITDSSGKGIYLDTSANYNIVSNNLISTSGSDGFGVYLSLSSNSNTIQNNTISTSGSDGIGVYLSSSSNSNITGNAMSTANGTAIYFSGTVISHFNHTIGSNTEYEEPIYYYFGNSSIAIENMDNIGELIVANSTNITVRNMTMDEDGIIFGFVLNSNIENSNFTTADGGIYFIESNYTNIANNTISTSGSTGFGIYLSLSSNSNTIQNNTISTSGSTGFGVSLSTSSNSNNIQNNTISTSGSNGYGISLSTSSNSNNIQNNTISTSGSSGYGVRLSSSSNSNSLTNNAITTTNTNAYGVYISASSSNNITGGSIIAQKSFDYYLNLDSASNTNNFTGTNFTAKRWIYFQDTSSWFNYQNDSSQNIWLKNKLSAAGSINRTLLTWSNSTMKWNETPSDTLTATYNLTGLLPTTTYAIYNTSGSTRTRAYLQDTDASGVLPSFTIALNGETQIQVQALNLSACGDLDLSENYNLVANVSSAGTCFNILADNVTLDGAGYTINYSKSATGYAINNTLGYNFTTIKNANIVQGNSTPSSSFAIYFKTASNGTIQNNTITTSGSWGLNIYLFSSSNSNTIQNNTLSTSGSYGYGVYVLFSNSNNILNNAIITTNTFAPGVYIFTSSNNIISGGSIISKKSPAYYLFDTSTTNNFTNTNFTALRNIGFYDSTSWFNYRNDSSQNIWLKTKQSLNDDVGSLNRTLTTWSNSTMKWNETPSTALTVTYNITGLMPSKTYVVYNTTGSTMTKAYTQDTDASGVLPSFTIALNGNTEIQVQALNLTSCGDLDLPETYNLVDNVSADSTCFTIKADNVTLDGNGYTINYSKTATGYAINNTLGYNFTTIKNANIFQGNSTPSSSYAIYFSGASDGTIQNNTITTMGSTGFGLWLGSSSNSNNIVNNTITTSGTNGHGVYFRSNSNSNNITNNIITTTNTTAYGAYIFSSSNNIIADGSIVATNAATYYLQDVDTTNNFTNTNFTAKREIQFADTTSWFNYNNDSSQNIWLKNSLSVAGSLNRTLSTWSNSTMKWNETPSAALTATYNLTGLMPTTTYAIYNLTGGTRTKAYTKVTDANGATSFDISLTSGANTQIQVQALNLTSCGDLDLPEMYNLVGNVSADATCFTIKSNNVTLDGNGYTINYSKTATGYAINNSEGYNFTTIKNANILQNTTQTSSYAIYFIGALNGTIQNNTISTSGGGGRGVEFDTSKNSSIANNSITTSGLSGYGVLLSSSSTSSIANNIITTSNSSGHGIYFLTSSTNTISNNNITTSGASGQGIRLDTSDTNTFFNNNIVTSNASAYCIYIESSSLNNIIGGSIVATQSVDYYLRDVGTTNNFTATNFTAQRNISFYDSSSWFNYQNDSLQNIWLKNKLSAAGSINRTLTAWSNTSMKWNETPSAALTATYNLTGLLPTTTYAIYNTSGSTRTRAYLQDTDASGLLPSFTIALNGETQIQVQALNLTSCGDLDLPETYNLVANVSAAADCFNIKSNNVTLDGAGYTINYSQSATGYAVNNSLGYNFTTIKNANIVQGNSTPSSSIAIGFIGASNGTIQNNNITTSGSWAYGVALASSSNSNITNNTITTSGDNGIGVELISSSNSNNLTNNAITTMNTSAYGVFIQSSSNNSIAGGSIIAQSAASYYIWSADTTNNFTDTNFTAKRWIYFKDTSSWFNYNNQTSGNIWLKTKIGTAPQSLNRTLTTWSNSTMKWNETPSATLTATYNITGLIPLTTYAIYNTSGSTRTRAYLQDTDASGVLPSFTIALNGETQIQVQALNLSACQDLDLPETYNLVADVSSAGTCFTIKSDNVTLDGAGYTINYSKTATGYAINNSLGYNFTTIKNANILQQNASVDNAYAIRAIGMTNGNLVNNTINISGLSTNIGIEFTGNDTLNIISNNTIVVAANSNSYGIRLLEATSNNVSNNNITTSGNSNAYGITSYGSSNIFSNNNISISSESFGLGLYIYSNSYSYALVNNSIIVSGTAATTSGIYLYSVITNSISGGSVVTNVFDYYLRNASTTNNFTNTNFTALRKIYFYDTTSWFNYQNDSTQNIWLKNKISAAGSLNRTLTTWSNNTMKWNETPSTTLTATYNITGLLASTTYAIYNTSGSTRTKAYTKVTDTNGATSFDISLTANTQIQVQALNLSACGDLDLPETYNLVANVSSASDCFNIKSNNVIFDGIGYTINYSKIMMGYAINNTLGYNFTTIKNVNIVQQNASVTGAYAIYLGASNGTIQNNNITTSGSSGIGIVLGSSSNSNVSNNTITTFGYGGTGIYLWSSSKSNTLSNNVITISGGYGVYLGLSSNSNNLSNNIITTTTTYGVYIYSSLNHSITGGSIIAMQSAAYYLRNASTTNTFINTNFTAKRNITFYDSTSWFNYDNETNGNIWLKNKLSAAGSINRTLTTWSNSTVKWNETPSATLTATYNITGLIPLTTYAIYNTSGSTSTRAYLQDTDADGVLPSFTIALNGETQIQVQALNISACGDLDLPEAYNLVANVSSAGTCFTIKANGIVLDGQNYWINHSQVSAGYGINITSRNNVTVKNLNIIQENSSITGASAIVGKGMVASNITNNTIKTSGTNSRGIELVTSSTSNIVYNNSINTTGGNSYGMYITVSNANTVLSNTITTSNTNTDGMYVTFSSNNNVTSNSIRTFNTNGFGIHLYSSTSTNVLNNSITTSGSAGHGLFLEVASDSNSLSDNNVMASNSNAYAIYIKSSNSNDISGGSLISMLSYDYYLLTASATNNFTNTNFTASRKISFEDVTSWLNYQNDSSQNIWIKTNVSAAGAINRTLVNWNTIVMRWNDTNSTVGLTARYNLTGMLPSTTYYVYNTSAGTRENAYTLTSDASGVLPSFTIALNGNTEIAVGTTTMVSANAENSNWTWALPYTGDKIRLGNEVNWQWTTFNNSGDGWIIPRGSATNWTWA